MNHKTNKSEWNWKIEQKYMKLGNESLTSAHLLESVLLYSEDVENSVDTDFTLIHNQVLFICFSSVVEHHFVLFILNENVNDWIWFVSISTVNFSASINSKLCQ